MHGAAGSYSDAMALVGRDRELDELDIADCGRAGSSPWSAPAGWARPSWPGRCAARRCRCSRWALRHVDLTRVDEEASVPGALAAQLGFDSFDALLLSSPADRPVLLVVDNCEHLLDAAAQWLVQILGACQQPTILATSRSPLELPGESVLPLAPLAVPEPGGDDGVVPVGAAVLRAQPGSWRRRRLGRPPGGGAELCRRVDGLPLALEIAAARARTMSIPEIVRPARRQRRRARPATLSRRPPPPQCGRHDPLVLRPAVGAGGRALRGVRRVRRSLLRPGGAGGGHGRGAVGFDTLLDELTFASLVTVDTSGPQTRYRLLETVRQFALDRLPAAAARCEPTYDRFADHVVASVREIVRGATDSWEPGARPRPRRRLR